MLNRLIGCLWAHRQLPDGCSSVPDEGAAGNKALMNRNTLAIALCGTVSSISFGASVVAIRLTVGDVDPVLLGLCRYAIASFLMTFVALRSEILSFKAGDLMKAVGLGVLFFGLYPCTSNAGLQYIPAPRAAIWLAMMPLTTSALGYMIRPEKPTRAKMLGIFLASLGAVISLQNSVISAHDRVSSAWQGDTLYLATICCGSVYLVLTKPLLKTYSALSITYISMLSGSTFLALVCAIQGTLSLNRLSPVDWSCILFLGTFGGALGWLLWIIALKKSTPTQTAVFMTLNPIAATLLSAVLFNETVTLWFIAGLVAVIGGVIITNRPASSKTVDSHNDLRVNIEAEVS